MTVLAWDGKYFAADKQMDMGGTPVPVTKIFKVGSELIGFTGDSQAIADFLAWYKSGRKLPAPPAPKDEFYAYVVRGNTLWKYSNYGNPVQINMPFWAAGAGADYAIGAMAAGKNAKEAVEIACKYCIYCGQGVDVFECSTGEDEQ